MLKQITKKENNKKEFSISKQGLYAILISASCKSGRFFGLWGGEDLRVEIDDIKLREIPAEKNSQYYNIPPAWNGSKLKGLTKTIIFLLNLKEGDHTIKFFPKNTATLEKEPEIIKIEDPNNIKLNLNQQAQNGNRRPWITLALIDLPLRILDASIKCEKRFLDSDDVKLIINGKTIENKNSSRWGKNWYWQGRKIQGGTIDERFYLDLEKSNHYIEFWADRMPTIESIGILLETKNIQDEQKKVLGKIALYKDMVSVDYVNFRSDPVINLENIIAEIKNGEDIEIIEKEIRGEYIENLSDIWHKIKWDGKDGYVLSSFIEISEQERNIVVEKIKEKSNEMGLDQKLMLVIAFQESKFKPFAVSYTGVKGLFQVTNDALKDVKEKTGYEVSDKFDFEQSMEAGLRYYKHIILPKFDLRDKQYLEKTIAAYNLGYNKIPCGKNETLIYKKLNVKEIKKSEVENYTKSILKNFYNKEWGKKLFFSILILIILAVFQLIGLNKINHIAYNASVINAFDKNSSQKKNIIELYNIENDISKNNTIDEIFNLKLGNEEKLLRIKGSRELIGNDIDKKVSISLNGKELLNKQEGLKDLLLWNSNILIARFWGGQTIYNYLFDLQNAGEMIPFISDGETRNFSSSAGGSWVGEIPVFGEVFFMYYKGNDLCGNSGEIFKLYGDLNGRKLIKIWGIEQTEDWCNYFKG